MDWRKIWVVARHEFGVNVRRAGFIIVTLSVPVVGIVVLLLGVFFGGEAGRLGAYMEEQFDVGSKRIGVVDRSGYFSPILPEYQANFTLYPDADEAEVALLDETLYALLILEADYLETGQVVVVTAGNSFGAAAVADSATVRAFLVVHLLDDQVEAVVWERAADPMHVEPRTLSAAGETEGEGDWGFVFTFVIPYLMAIFLVTTIFVSSGYLLQSVGEEKESRVIEIVVSSVRPEELMAGKVIGLGVLGLVQVLVWLASVVAFGGGATALLAITETAAVPMRVLVLSVVYYLLGYTLYAILMAGVGALGTTSQESQKLAGIFSIFASIPYMVSGFLFVDPNMPIARVLSYFPLTAPTMMMMRVPLAEVPWVDVAGSIVILVLSLPAALWVGAKLFRVGLLVYGKRPTAREIWAILRSR